MINKTINTINPAKSASPNPSNRIQEADQLDMQLAELIPIQDKSQHDTDKKRGRKSSADSFRKRKEKNKVSA